MRQPKQIAIVHEWFTSMRGGEKCVEALCEVFPQATVFALVHTPGSVSPTIEHMPIRTSFIQHLPLAQTRYRHYLPLFPTAVQQFDLRGFDIVISSNHCVAKGVRTSPETLHICYCHTPMRYIWDLYDQYFGRDRAGFLTRAGMRMVRGYLRRWDVKTAANPHYFIANSENVRQKIMTLYHRESEIVYPPVNTASLSVSYRDDGFFLIVSAFVPYKRIDLAIETFNRTGDRMVIVGDGPDDQRLRKLAGPTVKFVGWQPDDQLREYYKACRALVFPGEEDFGIVPLEAMAAGKPVVAFARGGALETVRVSPSLRTGVLFAEQTVESLGNALKELKELTFNPDTLREHALKFDREVYKSRMKKAVEHRWTEFVAQSPQAHTREEVIGTVR